MRRSVCFSDGSRRRRTGGREPEVEERVGGGQEVEQQLGLPVRQVRQEPGVELPNVRLQRDAAQPAKQAQAVAPQLCRAQATHVASAAGPGLLCAYRHALRARQRLVCNIEIHALHAPQLAGTHCPWTLRRSPDREADQTLERGLQRPRGQLVDRGAYLIVVMRSTALGIEAFKKKGNWAVSGAGSLHAGAHRA